MLNVTCPVCLAMLLRVASQLLSHVNSLYALCAVLLSATVFPTLFFSSTVLDEMDTRPAGSS